MTDAELDLSYTALCNALTAVGPHRSELMLSMVCVALMARSDQAAPVLEVIARSQQRLQEEAHLHERSGSAEKNSLADGRGGSTT